MFSGMSLHGQLCIAQAYIICCVHPPIKNKTTVLFFRLMMLKYVQIPVYVAVIDIVSSIIQG